MNWYKLSKTNDELFGFIGDPKFISGNYFLIRKKENSLSDVFNSILYIDSNQFNSINTLNENGLEKVGGNIAQNELVYTILSPEYFYGPLTECNYNSIREIRTLVANIVATNISKNHIDIVIKKILECSDYYLNEILVYTLSVCYLCNGEYKSKNDLLQLFFKSHKFINWKEKFLFIKNLKLKDENKNLSYSILFSDKRDGFFTYLSSKNKYFNSLEDFMNEKKSTNKIVIGHGDFNSSRILIKRKNNDLNLELIDLHEIFYSVSKHTNLFAIIACHSEDFYPTIPINTSVIYFTKTIQPRTVLFTCNYIIDFFNRNCTNEQIYLILREILFAFTNDSDNIRYLK
ncbi:MAG: hypothetical protein IPN79_12860 [Saprospiraceae bacterium]|nr:hypothetical protein [Saprospiraceae bacterium]